MTLVQLRHFLTLAKTGSFSKSAAAVFLTQPALSRSIRALEDELGLPLFDRIGRKCELTPLGREFMVRARQLVFDADELRASGERMQRGDAGAVRIGMGSGPGAMLMTPLLMEMATKRTQVRVEIARGSTDLLVQRLRERTLDALAIDVRSLAPAPDLRTDMLCEMRGAFLCRRGHPLAKKRGATTFEALRRYPLASTPLSNEIAHILMERYGPQAHPAQWVTLACEEIPSLVAVASRTDTVVLTIRAAGPQLVELALKPELDATARLALVTMAGRTEPPPLAVLRALMRSLLRD